jgi:hypothetical protein
VEAGHKIVNRPATAQPAAAPQFVHTGTHGQRAEQVQASLNVSSPHDPAEKEAEVTAKRIVRMPEPGQPGTHGGNTQRHFESPYIARFADSGVAARREPGSILRKAEGSANVTADVQNTRTAGSPLPGEVRRFMEPRFGADFANVRIHTDERAARLNTQLNARAFATGNHIFFARDRFQPGTRDGKELIAHELTHTLQQGAAVQRQEEKRISRAAASVWWNGKLMYITSAGKMVELPPGMSAEEAAALETQAQAAEKKLGRGPPPRAVPDVRKLAPKKDQKPRVAAKGKRSDAGKGKAAARAGAAAMALLKAVGSSKVAQYLAAKAAPVLARGVTRLQKLKENEQTHDDAGDKLKQSEKAVVNPPAEGQATSNAAQVHAVSANPPPVVEEKKAKQKLTETLAENVPRSIEDVDNFKRDKKAQHIGADVMQVVQVDKNAVVSTFQDLGQTPPPAPPEQTPESLPPEEMAPGTATMNLGQGAIVPLQKEHTDVSQYTSEADGKLKEEGVTQEQLDMVDSGDLAQANKEKKGMELAAKTEPLAVQKFAAEQAQTIDQDLKQEEKKGRDALKAKRKASLSATGQKQHGTKSALERKREEVANHINGIYKAAQGKVEKRLKDLETQSMKRFDDGNAKATREFEDNVNRELDAYKADRYSGWFGWARKAKDWLLGMDELPAVKAIFERNRTAFVSTIDTLVKDITVDNKRVIQECKDELSNARNTIKEYVDGLRGSLKEIGRKAQQEMNSKLDALDQSVAQKEQELQDKLKDKQQAAIKAIDEKIEKMKEAMSGALAKLGKLLLLAAKKFFTWALEKVGLSLATIEGIINKGIAVLKAIFTGPIRFVKNLIGAAGTGFRNFGKNFITHLKNAVFEWLTGSLEGLILPDTWDLKGILSVIFQMLGITYQNIRAHLVKLIPEPVVKTLETTFELVKTLITKGPMAAWEQLKQIAGEMQEAFVNAVKDWIKWKIVQKAIETVLSMFIPGAGIVRAIIGIYDTVVFFIQKAKEIMQMIGNFLGSIADIAAGNIGAAAAALEEGLARGLKLVISFLAKFLHLDGITKKIRDVIQNIRGKVDDVIGKVAAWIVGLAKKAGRFIVQAGVPQDPNERLRLAAQAALSAARSLKGTVTQALLNPILAGIKLRYGLQYLEPYQQGGVWWIKAVINPVLTQSLGVPTGAPGGPGAAADSPQVIKGAEIQLAGSGGGWRPYRYRVIDVIDGRIHYRFEGQSVPRAAVLSGEVPLVGSPPRWRLYQPNAGDIPIEELLQHNGPGGTNRGPWLPMRIARKVLNFRANEDESQSNPAGKEWDHIVEASAGGPNSVENLALADAGVNRDLGVWFGQRQPSAPGYPNTGPLTVREFLDAANVNPPERRRWKERAYRIFRVRLQDQERNRGRGPYRVLE